MKKKLFVICMAAVMACSSNVFAAETPAETTEAEETAAEEAAEAPAETEAAEETADAQEESEETTEAAEEVIGGLYIEDYSTSEGTVNVSIIAEPDLISTAQEAGTAIYDFKDDGTAVIYENGTKTEGTYTAEDGKLVVNCGEEKDYDYEFIDGLLVLHSDDDSSILYSFSMDDMSSITIDDYSTIEISESTVTVSDDDVNSYINSILQAETTYDQITEGTVESGDSIVLTYSGYLDGEEEPFESSDDNGIAITLGNGSLIDGFEDQVIGQEIGQEFDVKVTIPEDSDSEAAGKEATFKTTVKYKVVANTPELNDEFAQSFSEKYLTIKCENVDDLNAYARSYIEKVVLHNAILSALAAKTTITEYNQTLVNMLVSMAQSNLSYYAQSYGYDEDTYASLSGYDSADAYVQAAAANYLNASMITNKVMMDNDITYTLEDYNASIDEYIKLNGYDMTADEYKTANGTTGMWIYRNDEFKFNLAMSALEDRVVLVPDAEESTEAAEAESTEAEAETEAESAAE